MSSRPPQSVMESTKRPASIDHTQGEYQKRKMSEKWTRITPEPVEDGYSWHEYGLKEIFNAKYPRSYFRCSHKQDLGCQAIKQVQKTEDETPMYYTTYIGYHTCQDIPKAPQFVMDPFPREAFLLSLESNPPTKQELPCFSSFSSVNHSSCGSTSVLPSTSGSDYGDVSGMYYSCTSFFHTHSSFDMRMDSIDDHLVGSTSVFLSTSGSDYIDVSGTYSGISCSHSSFNMGMDYIDHLVLPTTSGSDHEDVSGTYSSTSCSDSCYDMGMDSSDWFC